MKKAQDRINSSCVVNLDKMDFSKKMISNSPCVIKLEQMDFSKKIISNSPCIVKLEKMDFLKKPISGSVNESPKSNEYDKDVFNPQTPKSQIEFSLELKRAIHERNILTTKTKSKVFEALDEIELNNEASTKRNQKKKVLLEIVNSEATYVNQLEKIKKFFAEPVKERKLLKPEDYERLFGNINTIYNVNKKILDELNKGFENVAMTFYEMGPFLKLYSTYACSFKDSMRILQNSRSLYPKFAKFVEMQETRPEVQNKLSALLITPIQRIPRYKLLLLELQKLTSVTEKDYMFIKDCLSKIEEAADHINKMLNEHENTQKLLEFQRFLYDGEPNVISPGRHLIKEGILNKMTNKESHCERLYVVLMNDIIMFNKMKHSEPKINSLKCFSIFPLNKCKLFEILDKGCFRIMCQDKEITLYNTSFQETTNWISKITEAIKNHIADRKTLRKESSSRRPVKRKDMLEYHEAGISPGRPLKKKKFDPNINSQALLEKNENESIIETEDMETQDHGLNNKQLDVYEEKHNSYGGFKIAKMISGVSTKIKNIFSFNKSNK